MDEEIAGGVFEKHKEHSPPYVAYKTFKNFAESLRVAMPSRIDRSVMHTMSGAAQSHIMSALRSMDFVSKQGTPTEAFRQFVISDGEQRKASLAAAIKAGFPFLFDGSIDLATATGKQLLEKFEPTPLTGNTLRRAVAFFLAAARDAGLPISPYFNKIQSRSGMTAKRSAPSNNGVSIPYLTGAAAEEEEDEEIADPVETTTPKGAQSNPSEELSITLKSGGTITLTATTSFIKMSADDRAFVFDIIDRLQKYGVTG